MSDNDRILLSRFYSKIKKTMKQKTNSVLIAISAMALFVSCSNTGEEQKKATPMRVKSEVVRLSTDVNKISYVGIVEEESAISVGFTGSGTISKVYVSEGQAVKKGQLLAELDKTQAQNMLATAQAQMMQATDAFKRLKQLHDNNSLPEMEWVEVQSKVQQAEAALEMAKKNLADCSIYAPESGIIGKGVMNVGEVVLPALPVAKILVISNVKIRASIPEKEIAGISSSAPSRITLEALPNQTFDGGKIEKCIEANNVTHTYDIKINVRNQSQQLLPGMVANVEINNTNPNDVVAVPITSVRKNAQGEYYVWINKEGKAYRKTVTVGDASGNRIIVSRGLNSGDIVITEGYQKLSEGMEVI